MKPISSGNEPTSMKIHFCVSFKHLHRGSGVLTQPNKILILVLFYVLSYSVYSFTICASLT